MTTPRIAYNKPRPFSAQRTDEKFEENDRIAALFDFDSDRIKPGDLGTVIKIKKDFGDTFVLVEFDVVSDENYWVEDWEITRVAE
jgi:hypothetical protein